MTGPDFNLIALAVYDADIDADAALAVAESLADALRHTNRHFDRDLFIHKATGLDTPERQRVGERRPVPA